MSRWLLFGLCLTGCNPFDTWTDWEDALGDKKPGRFESPGVRLLPGRFKDLSAAIDQKEGGAIYAKRQDDDGDRLIILRLQGATLLDPEEHPPALCDAGPVSSYEFYSDLYTLTSGRLIPSGDTTLVSFHDEGDGYGTIRFLNQECAGNELKGARGRLSPLYLSETEFVLLTRTRDGELVAFDRENFEPRTLVRGVDDFFLTWNSQEVWTLESGQLVRRDSNGRELSRHGEDVTWASGADRESNVFYIDRHGLSNVSFFGNDLPSEELIAPDGCAPYDGLSGLFYFAPCDEKRLHLRRFNLRKEPVHWDGPLVEHPVVTDTFPKNWLNGEDQHAVLTFVTGADPTHRRGRLHRAKLASLEAGGAFDAEVWAEDALLEESFILTDPGSPDARLHFLSNTFVDGILEPPRLLPYERVHHHFSLYYGNTLMSFVLADFDGSTGNLYQFSLSSVRLPPLLEDVVPVSPSLFKREVNSSLSARPWVSRLLVTARDRDHSQIRRIYDDPDTPDLVDLTVSAPLGRDVQAGTEAESILPQSIAYLTRGSALRVTLEEAAIDQLVHPHVSEFLLLTWRPVTGVAYVVPEGDQAGLWISKAR